MSARLKSKAIDLPGAPAAGVPAVSRPNTARLYYDVAGMQLLISENGGPYQAIPFGVPGAGGWTDAGAVVHVTTNTDQVSMGTAAPPATAHVFINEPATNNRAGLAIDTVGELGAVAMAMGLLTSRTRVAGMAANELYQGVRSELVGNAADNATAGAASLISSLEGLNASPAFHSAIIMTTDVETDQYGADGAFVCFGTDLSIGMSYAPPTFGRSPSFTVRWDPVMLAGQPGGDIDFIAAPADTAQAGMILLSGGLDAGIGNLHGWVRCYSQDPDQAALEVQADPAQNTILQFWSDSLGAPQVTIDELFDLNFFAAGAAAGSDSHEIHLSGVTSLGGRTIDLRNECEAGADRYRLLVADESAQFLVAFERDLVSGAPAVQMRVHTGVAPASEWQLWDDNGAEVLFRGSGNGAGAATVGVLAGSVASSVRPGQLVDNTTGGAGAILAAVAGSGADATINNNFKRLLDRVNDIEQKLTSFGLYT